MMLCSSFPDTVPEPQGDPKLGLSLNQQLPWKGNGGKWGRSPFPGVPLSIPSSPTKGVPAH